MANREFINGKTDPVKNNIFVHCDKVTFKNYQMTANNLIKVDCSEMDCTSSTITAKRICLPSADHVHNDGCTLTGELHYGDCS